MIRRDIIAVLVNRELQRLWRNPSALMLIGLLSAVALLMATSRPVINKAAGQADAPGQPHEVWILYDTQTPWIGHLMAHAPANPLVRFVDYNGLPFDAGRPDFPEGHSYVEIQHTDMFHSVTVTAHHAGTNSAVLDPFWDWFWPTTVAWHADGLQFQKQMQPRLQSREAARKAALENTSLADFVKAELVGTVLLLIVQFFSCCHLLVSFLSQDRERGTLSALVLSPATIVEILLAKFVFHICLSMLGSVAIVAILKPAALGQPLLWVTLVLTSIGMMCVGTCITALTKTQASAGLLALCYMLAGAVLFYLSGQFATFGLLRQLAFESYSFPLFYAVLKQPVSLLAAPVMWNLAGIVIVWMILARQCFYRFGWR